MLSCVDDDDVDEYAVRRCPRLVLVVTNDADDTDDVSDDDEDDADT